jgi:uncharacterized repeat protein (TIGR03803 family)
VLHSFGNGPDGANPRASLVALRGKLYGTTYQGGACGEGTVFSVRIADGEERVIHTFGNFPDGEYPVAGLINVNGVLYGTTQSGGAHGGGTVFSITTSGTVNVLFNFIRDYPSASLIAVDGMLYGTTIAGGVYDKGSVFSMTLTGANERVLHSFGYSTDGSQPQASLVAIRGQLYGTTYKGGTASGGTVFRVAMSGLTERVLHNFGKAYQNDGFYPLAALIDVKDTLYGTTQIGGISLPSCVESGICDYGTIFALTP